MARAWRTVLQSVVSPVLSTSLYFVVFGAAIGSRIQEVEGVTYGAFIVPGLIMLSLLTQSISNASFGIYFPRFTGTIYELLSAPVSFLEIVIGYVGAAATKSIIIGLIILATAAFSSPLRIEHPFWMVAFLLLTAITFSLFGFIIGIWADGFEQLQLVPLLIVTPLTFLGGELLLDRHAAAVLARGLAVQPGGLSDLGLPLGFFGQSDVGVGVSLAMTLAVPGALPRGRLVDLPDRLSAEGVSGGVRPQATLRKRRLSSPHDSLLRTSTTKAMPLSPRLRTTIEPRPCARSARSCAAPTRGIGDGHVQDQPRLPHRQHPRRRHRQGDRAGRHARAGGGGQKFGFELDFEDFDSRPATTTCGTAA